MDAVLSARSVTAGIHGRVDVSQRRRAARQFRLHRAVARAPVSLDSLSAVIPRPVASGASSDGGWKEATEWSETMTVAKVIEISAESPESFEDAIRQGIERAEKSVRNVRGAWVAEHKVEVDKGRITNFRVDLKVTFVLDD
jgi:hypothetical protein